MKILLAVDGSDYTGRMLSYLTAHKEWSGAGHDFTVFHVVLPVPHRAAAFAGPEVVHGYCEDDARMVLEPVRGLLARNGIEARFDDGYAAAAVARNGQTGDRVGQASVFLTLRRQFNIPQRAAGLFRHRVRAAHQ